MYMYDPCLANGVRRGEPGGSFDMRRALQVRRSRDSSPRRQVGQARPTQISPAIYDDDDDYQFDPYESPEHEAPSLNSDQGSQSVEEISEPPSAPVVRQGRRLRTRTNATQTYVISCSRDSEAILTVTQLPGLLTVIGIPVRSLSGMRSKSPCQSFSWSMYGTVTLLMGHPVCHGSNRLKMLLLSKLSVSFVLVVSLAIVSSQDVVMIQ